MKPLWRFAKNLETTEQMSGDQLLKTHGEKFFNAIDMVVNNLDEFNSIGYFQSLYDDCESCVLHKEECNFSNAYLIYRKMIRMFTSSVGC